MATITAATRTNYPCDAWLGHVCARAKEQLDKAARENFAVAERISEAGTVVARRQRRGLR